MKLEELEEAINEKRDEMINIGLVRGLSDEKTIYCSQELDQLLNEYNRLLAKYEKSTTIDLYDFAIDFIHNLFYRVFWTPYNYIYQGRGNRLN